MCGGGGGGGGCEAHWLTAEQFTVCPLHWAYWVTWGLCGSLRRSCTFGTSEGSAPPRFEKGWSAFPPQPGNGDEPEGTSSAKYPNKSWVVCISTSLVTAKNVNISSLLLISSLYSSYSLLKRTIHTHFQLCREERLWELLSLYASLILSYLIESFYIQTLDTTLH